MASRSHGKAQTYARENGFERSYGSYQALLKDPEVDVIYNPLPNHLHCEWTIRALEAGKHVLCEKPMALSVAECRRMIATAKRHRRLLMEAFMYRLHPQTLKVQELIGKGAIGEIRVIRAGFGFSLNEAAKNVRLVSRMGGGCLMDVGCYCVNAMRTFFREEPHQVMGQAERGKISGVDMTFGGLLMFSRGRLRSFQLELSNRSRLGRGDRRHAGTHLHALALETGWATCQFSVGSKREEGDGTHQEWWRYLPLRGGPFQPMHSGRKTFGLATRRRVEEYARHRSVVQLGQAGQGGASESVRL